jgi:hypothetical protein
MADKTRGINVKQIERGRIMERVISSIKQGINATPLKRLIILTRISNGEAYPSRTDSGARRVGPLRLQSRKGNRSV